MITQDSYRKLNEISSGDVRITKAVILLPGYLPRNRIDLCRDFSHDVHALYNTYAWNIRTNSLSSGEILSHSEIAYRNHVDPKKIIGYLVKEGNQPVECDLLPDAYSSLRKNDVDLLVKELKNEKWS